MSEYSDMPECELIKLKNMYLDKAEQIDRILRKESAVQKTEYAIQRLKKLMDTNKSYEYMCISEKRTGTGPESHYFVNYPLPKGDELCVFASSGGTCQWRPSDGYLR